jgi:hypothetical protein
MTQFDPTNRGTLFKNDRKESDSHPDYKGSINVNGEELWLSAWIKDGKNGKFMSLSVKPKEAASAPRKAVKQPAKSESFDDSDVPFIRCDLSTVALTSKQKRMSSYDY